MGRGDIERDGWRAAAAGAVLTALVFALPFATHVFSYMIVLVHELGHALGFWLYGYPALPAFDFVYGGGVTTHQRRIPALTALVLGAGLWLAWTYRHNPRTRNLALAGSALYALTAWSSLHQPVVTAMGHGAELVFAGIFLHRALSGSACHHEVERPLYAFLGFFTVLYDLRFAVRLVQSSFHREVYQQAKGGGHWMDFSVLAEQHLHVPLEAVAACFAVACLLPPLVSFALNHQRRAAAAFLAGLLDREPPVPTGRAGLTPRRDRPRASA